MQHARRMMDFFRDLFTPEQNKAYYQRVFEILVMSAASQSISGELSCIKNDRDPGFITYSNLFLLRQSAGIMSGLELMPDISAVTQYYLHRMQQIVRNSNHERISPCTYYKVYRQLKQTGDWNCHHTTRGMMVIDPAYSHSLITTLRSLKERITMTVDIDTIHLQTLAERLCAGG